MKSMIILMHHGADDDDRLGGWSDAKLSEVGIEQVRRASEQITQFHICHIFSSDLPRARESREAIQPLIRQGLSESEINENIKTILYGDGKEIW